MKVRKLKIKTKSQEYSIFIGSNILMKLNTLINEDSIKFNKCLLIIDKKIPNKFILKIKKSLKHKKVYSYSITANEKNKSQKTTNNIINFLLKENFSRQDCLIAIGGGITGDIGGFAASLFKRGMQFINIPTTLLSQVDSSIGGKTGVNTKYGKNLIGSFYQPSLVISDTTFLKSLPKREINCGYAEILKHSLISSKKFYKFLDKNVNYILDIKSPFLEKAIYESCKIKKIIVVNDEKEKNLRKILNFGHTFAHAYEATLNYSKKLNHGEAVILGIKTALSFSFTNNLLGSSEYYSMIKHLENSKLPTNIKKFFTVKHVDKIISFMLKDKKNSSDEINLVLLKKIGFPVISKIYKKNKIKVFLKKELLN